MDLYEFAYTADEICCTFDLLMESLESELVAAENMSKETEKSLARYALNRFKSTYMPALRLVKTNLFDLAERAKIAEGNQYAETEKN